MSKLSDQLNRLHIVVVGDALFDSYEYFTTAQSKELRSEQPGQRAYVPFECLSSLGGAGNVAANLASVGIRTTLITVLGPDATAHEIRAKAKEWDIDLRACKEKRRRTSSKLRVYIDGKFQMRIDRESSDAIGPRAAAYVQRELRRVLPRSSCVILSDYNKGVFRGHGDMVQALIKSPAERGKKVVVDCKPENTFAFANADVVSPNLLEAEALVNGFSKDYRSGIRKLHQLTRAKATVVTLGSEGICGYQGRSYLRVPGLAVNAVDTVGAGDTVRAFLAVGLALGLRLKDALRLGNTAAALVVQKKGTSVLDRQEFEKVLSQINSAIY
jgi:D-beta-D-heptose 7-phosphate kinase/D-beta-D-heptose 1-phosphate adenosyltransferase